MSPIGLIGIGLLGTALARRLGSAGFTLVGFDLDPARRQALADLGGSVRESAAEVLTDCDRVLLSLPTSTVVQKVLSEVSDHLRPGQLFLDTTTGDPEHTVAIAA